MTAQMQMELITAIEDAAASGCRVLVLTGAGDAFCSGLDLSELQGMRDKTAAEHRLEAERVARLFLSLYEFPVPTIAAVHGAAIAGGAGLPLFATSPSQLPKPSLALLRRALVLFRPWCLHFSPCRLEISTAVICC